MTELERVPFIGRADKLTEIEALIKADHTQAILCIEGKQGGVGKTRLMQETRQRFASPDADGTRLLAEIIDFDNLVSQIPEYLAGLMAERIAHEAFRPYYQAQNDLTDMERAGLRQERLDQERELVRQAFATCFNQISAQRRIVLFFDTTDALKEKKEVWLYLIDLLPHLRNYLLIMAGRNASSIGQELRTKLEEKQPVQLPDIHFQVLKPFDVPESYQYLEEKLNMWYTALEADVAEKLVVLAQGLPILIDLAVEWQATSSTALSWLKGQNLADLQNPSPEIKQEFEKQLVLPIAEGRRSIDRLMLIMSRIYPINEKLAMYLLDLEAEEVQKLFMEAQRYVSIKPLPGDSLKLHDEVERMVNDYLWNIIDPDQSRRLRESRKVADYFKAEVDKAAAEIKNLLTSGGQANSSLNLTELRERQELLIIQRLTHTLVADLNKGFTIYSKTVNQARNEKRYRLAQRLQETVRPYLPKLSPDQSYQFNLWEGRLLNDTRKFREANLQFKELLDKINESLRKTQLFEQKIKESAESKQRSQESLELKQKTKETLEQKIKELSPGYKSEELLELEQKIKEALELEQEINVPELEQETREMLEQKIKDLQLPSENHKLFELGQKIKESLELEQKIKELGQKVKDLPESEQNIKKELQQELQLSLEDLPEFNRKNLARVADIYNALGTTEIQLGHLNDALWYQEKSLQQVEQQPDLAQAIPLIANQIGYTYRLMGKWEEAIQYYQRALEESTKTNGFGTMASIMNNLGYVLGMNGKYDQAIGYCEDAIELWRSQNSEILIGQGESTLGTIYRNKGEYDKAEAFLSRAIDRFEKGNAIEYLIRAKLDLGILYAMKGNDLKNQQFSDMALGHLRENLKLANEHFLVKECPRILLELSYVYQDLGQFEEARQYNEEASKKGKEVDDTHSVVNSLVAKAEYDYLAGQYDNIQEYAHTLKEEYEESGYLFPLLSGQIRRILADVFFQKGEYDKSFYNYANGLALIAQHGGYGRYSIQRELESLKKKLATLTPHVAIDWCRKFKEQWEKQEPQEKYAVLVSWCDRQVVQAKLRMTKG